MDRKIQHSQRVAVLANHSTPAELDGANFRDSFISRERILRIFSLRSRHTCTGASPIERTAAGRSEVVARIFGMQVEHVRGIWRREIAPHITESMWVECEHQRNESRIKTSNLRRSHKRKHQGDQQTEQVKRRHAADQRAYEGGSDGSCPSAS